MIAEDKYLNEHFTVSDIKFSREEMVIIMRKYTKLQCQKRDELIGLFEQLVLILKYPESYKEGAKEHVESKIEQLKIEIK